jgi:predicted ATPase/DNA-binding SARP family transcriptional activator/Tfp pilus assembly protein PilF
MAKVSFAQRPTTTRFIVSRLTLSLLGQPRIECDGAPIVVDTRKATALLAYVAVTHQHHSRDTLAVLLWPEYDHVRAYANLRRTIWALNKALAGDYLNIDRDTIGLNPQADLWIDVDHFTTLLASCRTHGHPETEICPACLEALAEAAEIYRADFLHGFTLIDSPGFDDWQFFQAESLERSFAQALERLVEGYSAQGEFATAIVYARRWLALDALHEPAHRALMQLYAWSGQRSAALRQYRECTRVLQESLGAVPQPATQDLYEAIRGTSSIAPAPHQAAPAFAPAQPPPGADADVAAPVSEWMHNLPAQPGAFVGRDEELSEIATLLSDPTCRLLTLVGPGGIGKTRLAIQAAAEQRGSFSHGVYFVPCAAVSSPTALASSIADALRFSFYAAGDPQRQMLDFLRPKNLLLVVDNAEYLAGAVALLTEILAGAPAIKILATSIERLNLHEEWALEIQGLRYPEDDRAPDVERYSAVQFFIQSARRAYAGFVPDDADRPQIVRICQLVAGMPVGIELAASWLRVLACREIVREVENNLDFLATSLRDVPDRHRSLRAVFEHSWELLSAQEQHILSKLAVFRGGFRREAAERVAGAGLPLLLDLVNKSLLRRNGAGRYEMLEVIRQYAEERLDAESRRAAQEQHSLYYADLLRLYSQDIKGGRQQEALADTRQELANMRAGWAWAVESARRQDIQSFAGGLYRFYEMSSRFQEGEELFKQVAERLRALHGAGAAQAAIDDLLIAQIGASQGGFCYRLGRSEQALQLLQDALVVFRMGDAFESLAFCLICLGDIARIKGQYPQARVLLEEGLAIASQVGDRSSAARAYTNLGIVSGASGEYREAKQLFQEGLAIFQALGDQWGEAKVLINLGVIAYYLHEYSEAQKLLRASLVIAQAIDNSYDVAVVLNNLGIVAGELGQYAEAKQLHQESCTISERIGYRLGAGLALNDLGHVARALGEDEASRGYFVQALRTALAIQATPLALDVLVGIALLIKDIEADRAYELLVLAQQHPASGKETRDRAAGLLAELEAQVRARARADSKLFVDTFDSAVEQLLLSWPA